MVKIKELSEDLELRFMIGYNERKRLECYTQTKYTGRLSKRILHGAHLPEAFRNPGLIR